MRTFRGMPCPGGCRPLNMPPRTYPPPWTYPPPRRDLVPKIPTPSKDMEPETPLPLEETDTCENIAFGNEIASLKKSADLGVLQWFIHTWWNRDGDRTNGLYDTEWKLSHYTPTRAGVGTYCSSLFLSQSRRLPRIRSVRINNKRRSWNMFITYPLSKIVWL